MNEHRVPCTWTNLIPNILILPHPPVTYRSRPSSGQGHEGATHNSGPLLITALVKCQGPTMLESMEQMDLSEEALGYQCKVVLTD